jgi:hypothetical protein
MESALRSSALPSVLAAFLGLRAGVATGISVAVQFPADVAGRSMQHESHSADAVVLLLQADQCHTVFRLQLAVVRGGGIHLLTLQVHQCCTSLLNPQLSLKLRNTSCILKKTKSHKNYCI